MRTKETKYTTSKSQMIKSLDQLKYKMKFNEKTTFKYCQTQG